MALNLPTDVALRELASLSLSVLGALSVGPREVLTVLVLNEEAGIEHLAKDLLGVLVDLLLGLDLCELLLEAVDEPELLLKGGLFGLGCSLVILNLLLRPSSLARHLHSS